MAPTRALHFAFPKFASHEAAKAAPTTLYPFG